jgi:hypothetical protein
MTGETSTVSEGQGVSFGQAVMLSLKNTVANADESDHDDMQSGLDWMEHEAISIEAFLSTLEADL